MNEKNVFSRPISVRKYYSAQVTQVHSFFPNSHNPMRRQSETTGERSGTGPTG